MKKVIFKSNKIAWMLSILMVVGVASCKKLEANLVGGTGAPTITAVHTVSKTTNPAQTSSVTTYNSSGIPTTVTTNNTNNVVTAFDSITTVGKGGTLYRIQGTNLGSVTGITFNGVTAYFNDALVSDNSIIVAVPTTAPYGANQAGVLIVTTLHGSATYKFSIQQPPPTITSFNPVAGAAGDTITINGVVLDGATSVTFGTVAAKIVSNTTSQIKVLLPAGVVQAFITVTTAGGTGTSLTAFGFKYLIYGDALTTGWGGNGGGYTGYSGTVFNFANTSFVERGTNSIQVVFGGQYSAAQIGYGGAAAPSVSALGLTSLKFFVYGGPNSKTGDQLQIVLNGNYGAAFIVTITAGAYTSVTIPLSSLGNPTTITEFVAQTFQTTKETVYIDDLGFI
jgi:hypothetical protein